MPLLRDTMDSAPAWCELSSFEIVRLPVGARREFPRQSRQERLLVASGACRLRWGGEAMDAEAGSKAALRADDEGFLVSDVREPTTLVRLSGDWGEETGGWGLFSVQEIEA